MFTASNLKKIAAIAMAVIGLVVIILGTTLLGDVDNHSINDDSFRYSAEYYSSDDASFGADFYTYMYDASDMIVDELNDINGAMAVVVEAQDAIVANTASNVRAIGDLIEAAGKVGGIITISIGLAIMASAVKTASTAFAPAAKKEQPEEAAQI